MSLGERIYKFRSEKKLSQGDLADALDVSRQSISKWETNGSVPELDKLVKLSQLFEISLDELVLDKKPPEESSQPEPKVIYVEKTNNDSGKKTAGVVLLCFAAMLWLIITFLGDVVTGLLLALPFAACGLVCLIVRKYIGLWCCWIVYFFVNLYLRFATGVHWQYIFYAQIYTGEYTIHLIVAWAILLVFATLTLITALCFKKTNSGTARHNAIVAGISWAGYVLGRFGLTLLARNPMTNVEQIRIYSFTSYMIGCAREVVLVLAVVFSLRLIDSLRNKHR